MSNNNSFQRFLWAVAGAEIPILEKCRTDHKKFAAIGATILMTAFIAFLSGTSAAWYFTQSGTDTTGNIGWAVAFGLVWSTLIFCIDRSLVITMKKDPEKSSNTWWIVPLVSRGFLALVIAFMVSIPLELVVFEDFIAEQEYFWTENKSNALSQNSRANRASIETSRHIEEGNNSLKRLDGQKANLEGEKGDLQQQLANERAKLNHPTTTAYRQASEGLRNANARIASLQHQASQADQWARKSIYSNIRVWQGKKRTFASIMSSEVKKWNQPINENIKSLQEEIEAKMGEIAQKQKELGETQNQVIEDQKRRANLNSQRDSLVEAHDKTMKQGNHFIQNFEILEYAVSVKDIDCLECNGAKNINGKPCSICHGTGKQRTERPMECYFLWLIRLLFFIIELLPTVVKIVMPIGAYQRMVYAEEKDMENYLNSSNYLSRIRNMHDMEIKAHEEQLQYQQDTEKEIRAKLMEELKAAQIEIAEAAVKKWRETELNRINNEGLSMTPEPLEENVESLVSTGLKPIDIADGVKRTEYPT